VIGSPRRRRRLRFSRPSIRIGRCGPPRCTPACAAASYARWSCDIDLDANVIRVQRSWDAIEGLIEPKTHAGRRTVPVPGVLRSALVEHVGSLDRSNGLAFCQSARVSFQPKSLSNRTGRAWERAGLQPITLHECRHTFASLMIAAGVNAKALSTYMGHASVMITLDRYGHLMPGNEREAAGLLDAFLSRSRGE
jgi:integrase